MLRDPEGLATALKAKSHLIAAAVMVLCLLYFLVMRLTAHRDGTRPEAFRKGARASHGLPGDVPSAGWRCHVFGILGVFLLIRHNPVVGDYRIGRYEDVKENTSVKLSTRKGFVRCDGGEIHCVKYSR